MPLIKIKSSLKLTILTIFNWTVRWWSARSQAVQPSWPPSCIAPRGSAHHRPALPRPPPPALAPPPIFLFVRFACSGRFGHFVPTDSRLAVCVWLLSLSLMSSRLPRGAARVSPSAAPRVARARCAHAFTHGTPGILPFLGRREQGRARHSIVPAALPVCCLSLQARPFLRLKSKTYLFQTLRGGCPLPTLQVQGPLVATKG